MQSRAGHPAFRVCSSCGAAVAIERDACGACGSPYGPEPLAVALEPTRRWGRLSCQFRCASCGVLSPLNQLDMGPSVSCAQCGFEQALDARAWSRVLAMAHDVVDLASCDPSIDGARPPSRLALDNPYRNVGRSVSEWSWQEPGVIAGRQSLELRVSPGHPLCERCHAPRSLATLPDGSASATCSNCGARENYKLPEGARALYPALEATLGTSHRSASREATTQFGADGTARVSCAYCGAPLEIGPRMTCVTCAHCHAESLISNKLWFRLGVREPFLEPIWLAFQGRSPRRRELEDASSNIDPFELELQARARAVLSASAEPASLPNQFRPMPGLPSPVSFEPPVPRRSPVIFFVVFAIAFVFAGAAIVTGALMYFSQ